MNTVHDRLLRLAAADPEFPSISLSYLGEIERGSKNPRLEVLLAVAMVLDLSPAQLFSPSLFD